MKEEQAENWLNDVEKGGTVCVCVRVRAHAAQSELPADAAEKRMHLKLMESGKM